MSKQRLSFLLLSVMMWLVGSSVWAIEQDAKGVYQIGTAQDLADFATLVNSGTNNINGVITADIDYTGQTVAIANANNVTSRFYGTLDGQGHTVTINLEINETYPALIRYNCGIIRNLCVDGTLTTGSKSAGGIVAANYGVVENCVFKGTINNSISGDATLGGIIGSSQAASVVRNCVFAGTVNAASADRCGGIVGWASGATAIQNCLNIGEMNIDMGTSTYAISRNPTNAKVSNCYYLEGFGGSIDAGAVALSAEDIKSGRAAYLLGIGQNIGTDEYPIPYINNARVYATADDCMGTNATGFTNTPVADSHTWNGDTCTVCGKVNPDFVTAAADGYYEISTPAQLCWFAKMVNSGNNLINGRLTADLDMTGVDFPMIGTTLNYYRGCFDGQHHVIKALVLNNPTVNNVGLFANIAGCARVENITLDKDCYFQGYTHIGAIGQSYGSGRDYIGGIINFGQVVGTPPAEGGSTDAGVGGIVGNCPGGNVGTIENCAMLGSVSGTSAAQISGWCGSNQYTIKGCWSIAEIPEGQSTGSSFFRQGSGTTVINCAQVNGTQVDQVAASDVAGGGLCWVINGKSGDQPVWYQKIGTDTIPTLVGTDVVYQVGTKKCDGSMGEGFGYSNENTGFVQEPHNVVDGFCTVCGQLPADEDGYLLVSSAKALKWIADQVNSGNTKLNFRLTADIDLQEYNPWTPIGNDTYKFQGNMDGGKHTISNMIVNDDVNNCAGLFGTVAVGDFSDLLIDASCSVTGIKYCGGLIGHSYGGNKVNLTRIGTMCDVTCSGEAAAGLIGNANSSSVCNITSCWTTGKISASKDAACFSGWEGNVGAVIKDSWSTSEVEGYQDAAHYLARYGGITISNCYGPEPNTEGGLKNISADGVATGALCFELNGEQKTINWFQNLGEGGDACPVPWNDHKQVYGVGEMRCDGAALGTMTYSNTQGEGVIPAHTYDHGICAVCGTLNTEYKSAVNGAYYLDDPQDILWFAAMVNNGSRSAGARLTADMDMSGVMEKFSPIGAGLGYSGTFDGQGHTISNFVYEQDGNDAGFIGVGLSGMTLKNIIFDSSCSITSQNSCAGAVGGSLSGETGTLTFEKVGYEGKVTVANVNAGGIIGCNHGSTALYVFKNCYVTGKIVSLGSGESGALTGWAGKYATTVTSCWSTAEVTGYQEGRDMLRYGTVPTVTNSFAIPQKNTEGEEDETPQFPTVTEEEVSNGSLCWKLNGKSFLDAVWYQTVGAGHPTFNSEEGLVYSKGEEGYASVIDEDSYYSFRDFVISSTKEESEEMVATQSVIDDYVAQMEALSEIDNLESFLRAYRNTLTAKAALQTSISNYDAYDAACQYAIVYLSENSFSCEERTKLENYLHTNVEPGEEFANGSYLYVMENHVLSDSLIIAETKYVNELLTAAIAADYQPGTEITDLLTNPTLADGFTGWDVTNGCTVFRSAGVNEIMPAAEGYNSTFDMTQKLTGLKPGVYMMQANAAFRAFADITSSFYAGMIKLNDTYNYIMTEGEDVVSKEDAVDGVNCHLTGDATDYSYVFGDVEGYVPYGPVSLSYAFSAGRYLNYVATTVGQDSTLTVGIENKGTGQTRDWTGFGNFRLYYLGSAEQANEKLDAVLAGYNARAQVIIDFLWSDALDFASYPNVSAELLSGLEEAQGEIATAETGEQKMALIAKFSDLFKQVYECRKAYIQLADAANRISTIADNFKAKGLITEAEATAATDDTDEAWTAYSEGSASAAEALALVEKISSPAFLPAYANDAYQLATAKDLSLFAALVNAGSYSANAVMTADIDMTGAEGFQPIGYDENNPTADNTSILYKGHFDGQMHRISNLVIDMPDNVGVGLFGSITVGAVIENFVLDATCSITGKDRAGIVGRSTASGAVTLRKLGNEGNVTATTAPAGILGNANASSNAFIYDCYSTGVITGSNNATQIVGWLGTNLDCAVSGCWSIASVTGADSDAKTFYRMGGMVPHTNNYSNMGDGSEATTKTLAAFKTGEITYLLNGKSTENPTWYQTIGVDEHPVFDSTHKVVNFADGLYYNEDAIEKGDVNADGIVDGSDLVAMVNMIMASGYAQVADMDDNSILDGSDVVRLVVKITGGDIKEFSGVFHFAGKKYTVNKGIITVE